ncbi:putative quinol monooxygenase [Lichenifustis flavocetrariae]|uniref:Antibiotic biosynthesis monooxygenase n=1 Tax=Lichenifustis flavocetrariae TaxID=2949735 RepID=A0AA41Z8U8_9HYPH|nr:antibiotic biosynthesis monooxygenase [Lichenifustis flavocetrariae]MCW6512445.1 antibiotic biosynthesis monooxygenase [Lichenifustis flavocetrariae]
MVKFALLVELKAKPGKEAEVEAFLEKEATLVRGEPGTRSWHAAKIEGEPGLYRVFDTFDDEVAREAHLNGEAGQELVEKADELFAVASKVHRLQIVAQK